MSRPTYSAGAAALVAALLCLAPAIARSGPGKGRTLQQLVDLTEASGKMATVGNPLSANLGFAKPPSGKTLSYDEHLAKGLNGHDFTVVRDVKQVSALIWGNTGFKDGVVDGLTFRSTSDGKLISAVSANGKVGHVVQTKLDVKAAKTRQLFEHEVRFFLIDSAAMRPEK